MEVTTMTQFIDNFSDKDSTTHLSHILMNHFTKSGLYREYTTYASGEDIVSNCWNFIAKNYDCEIIDHNDYAINSEIYDKKIIAMNHDLTDEKLEKYISLFLLQNT